MKIKDFLNYGPPPAAQAAMQTSQKAQTDVMPKKKTTNQPVATPPTSVMTINILVEKPDIILLEDMDDMDSNCIVLNVCRPHKIFGNVIILPCN